MPSAFLLSFLVACGGGTGGEESAQRPTIAAPSTAATAVDARTGPVGEDGRAASCVELYNPQTLPNRSFAFDGTVTSIGPGVSNQPDKGHLDTAAVTFEVNEWFTGGSGPTVTVDLMVPESSTPRDPPAYEEGTRLLVSGEPRWGGEPLEDAIAWSCGGFTRYYEEAVADEWRRATA